MTIYLVGNAPADFDSPDSSNTIHFFASSVSTTTGSSTNDGVGMAVRGTPNGFAIDFSQDSSEFWLTYFVKAGWSQANTTPLTFKGSDGTDILRFRQTASSSSQIDLWDGSAWINVVSTFTFNPATDPSRFDLKFKMHDTAGVIEVYKDNVLVGSYSGDTLRTSSTTVSRVALNNYYTSQSAYVFQAIYSQILAMDTSTRGVIVKQLEPSAAGNYSGQDSGVYTDIDEVIPTYPAVDQDKLVFSVADAKASFPTGSLPSSYDTGWQVISLVVSPRVARGIGSSVSTVAPMVRTATGVDAFASPQTAPETTFNNRFAEFTVNPDTGSAWTVPQANSAQIGVKVAT